MSRKLDFLLALGEFVKSYQEYIKHYPDGRIVGFYRPSEKNDDEFQLYCADGSYWVHFPTWQQALNGTVWAEVPRGFLEEDIETLGEPEPWPFDFLEKV